MPLRLNCCLLVAALVPLLTGCPQSPPVAGPAQETPVTTTASSPPQIETKSVPTPDLPETSNAPASGKIELRVVDLKGYENIVARQLGKVVLVDFWATWCAPCRQQFPHAVQLHNKFQDQGLSVISVSIDQLDAGQNLDDLKTKVTAYLNEQNASFPNLLVPVTDLAPGDEGATDVVTSRFDIDGGAIPHFKLYDRKGNLHKKFTVNLETGESFDPKEIDAAVEKLLAE